MKRFLGMLVMLVTTFSALPVFAKEIIVRDGGSIQDAIRQAVPGDTVKVYPGTYHEAVYIDKDDIHLTGIVKNGKWPVMDGADKLNDGILVGGHGITVERFYVRRYKANGIMTQGGNNFKIISNIVEGTNVYGIFPQFGKNGLVAHNILWGTEDAAIYVGMCENVDVLFNETYGSVMGIETENSSNILVEGNFVHDNTAGIVVSLVPGLPIKTADNTIIRNNFITNNNIANFAPEGAIAAGVPSGTGIMIYAADGTSIENNIITENDSVGIFVADHSFIGGAIDPKADPRPDRHKILSNLFFNNGTEPKAAIAGLLSAAGLVHGPDLMATGKGRKNCVTNLTSLRHAGLEKWTACAEGETTASTASLQLAEPLTSPELSLEQKGRLTYLAVCTGCHSYSHRIVGPPMVVIKALYRGRPEAMAEWIAHPMKKREDYPDMPPQNYLPKDVREQVAKYILEDLKQ